MSARSTSGGSVGSKGSVKGLPLLVRAPVILRNLALARRLFPSNVMVSWSLDTGVRAILRASA